MEDSVRLDYRFNAYVTSVERTGDRITLNVANCMTGAVYTVWMATNLNLAASSWAPVMTNISPAGNFTLTVTNALGSSVPAGFYLLRTH